MPGLANPLGPGSVVLGKYEIQRPLGEGGMGKVFLGRQHGSGKQVVVKIIHDHLVHDPKVRQSFASEVEMMMRFRHPNAVALLDANLSDPEHPCLVMEYVNGVSLEQLVSELGRLPPTRVGRLLGQLGPALQAAHDRNILHRDLTPVNIMVVHAGTPHEAVRVLDFGLARLSGFYLSLDRLQGSQMDIGGGTPDFIAPEQIRGDEVDQRSDLYSVGILLYYLLTAHVPFEEATEPAHILHAQLTQAPPPFAHFDVAEVPAAIESLVMSCLAKYPRERPQSARKLVEKYQQALGRQIFREEDFVAPPDAAQEEAPYDPRDVLDRFEAWMPEAVAVMKLRGFFDSVGGQLIESAPGLIKMRLKDPSAVDEPRGAGVMSWFKPSPKKEARTLVIDLHLVKRQRGHQNLVEITVVRPGTRNDFPSAAKSRQQMCGEICRELRSYLMIGR